MHPLLMAPPSPPRTRGRIRRLERRARARLWWKPARPKQGEVPASLFSVHGQRRNRATFKQDVVERSKEVPVIVDFWAEWWPLSHPRPGDRSRGKRPRRQVELAKVDVDSNQQLAGAFRVGHPGGQGLRERRDGRRVHRRPPPAEIEAFLDRIIPAPEKSEEELAEEREQELNSNEFVIAGREAREELEASGNPPAEAFKAWEQGDHEFAFDLLQKEVELAAADPDRRDLLRKVMVGYFTELGPASELAASPPPPPRRGPQLIRFILIQPASTSGVPGTWRTPCPR